METTSVHPPLVLVCAARYGRGARQIRHRGHFVVNVLAAAILAWPRGLGFESAVSG